MPFKFLFLRRLYAVSSWKKVQWIIPLRKNSPKPPQPGGLVGGGSWRPAGLLPPYLLYRYWRLLIQDRPLGLILHFLSISVFLLEQRRADMS